MKAENTNYYQLSDGLTLSVLHLEGQERIVEFFGNVTKALPNGSRTEKIRLKKEDVPEVDVLLVGACFIGPEVQFHRTYNAMLKVTGEIVVMTKGNDKAVPIQPKGSERYTAEKPVFFANKL